MTLPMRTIRFEVGNSGYEKENQEEEQRLPLTVPVMAPADGQQDRKQPAAQANRKRDQRLGVPQFDARQPNNGTALYE